MDSPWPDLAACADEPIPVTGALQPHGRLLVLAGEPAGLAACRENGDGVEATEAALAALADLETGPAHWPPGEAWPGQGARAPRMTAPRFSPLVPTLLLPFFAELRPTPLPTLLPTP